MLTLPYCLNFYATVKLNKLLLISIIAYDIISSLHSCPQSVFTCSKLTIETLEQTLVQTFKCEMFFIAHELEKIRAIFKSKQNELAEAVKKVDTLTHELESRKNGESGWKDVPTPERINRRKKIQAAKDELDRLRNELIVRMILVG